MPTSSARAVGTGLAFIAVPLVFVFAFAVHPDLIDPRLLSADEVIDRAHRAGLLQLGHAIVLLGSPLLVVVALHLIRVLDGTRASTAGFVGGATAIVGALMLAADKGALCLTMSAFDTLPEDAFAQLRPGLEAMFDKRGWMVLTWGIVLLPVGFAVQAIAALQTRTLPRWQATCFLIGVLLIGVPDGLEIINLGASIVLALAFVPLGARLIADAVGSPELVTVDEAGGC